MCSSTKSTGRPSGFVAAPKAQASPMQATRAASLLRPLDGTRFRLLETILAPHHGQSVKGNGDCAWLAANSSKAFLAEAKSFGDAELPTQSPMAKRSLPKLASPSASA